MPPNEGTYLNPKFLRFHAGAADADSAKAVGASLPVEEFSATIAARTNYLESYLCGSNRGGSDGSGNQTILTRKTMSMLEMKELADIRAFDNVIIKAEEEATYSSKGTEDNLDVGEDLFFYDKEDANEEKEEETIGESTWVKPQMRETSEPPSSQMPRSAFRTIRKSQSFSRISASSKIQSFDPSICARAEADAEKDVTDTPPVKSLWPFDPSRRPKRSSLKNRGSFDDLASFTTLTSGSSSGDLSSGSTVMKRNVSFSSLEIREYEIQLGEFSFSRLMQLEGLTRYNFSRGFQYLNLMEFKFQTKPLLYK